LGLSLSIVIPEGSAAPVRRLHIKAGHAPEVPIAGRKTIASASARSNRSALPRTHLQILPSTRWWRRPGQSAPPRRVSSSHAQQTKPLCRATLQLGIRRPGSRLPHALHGLEDGRLGVRSPGGQHLHVDLPDGERLFAVPSREHSQRRHYLIAAGATRRLPSAQLKPLASETRTAVRIRRHHLHRARSPGRMSRVSGPHTNREQVLALGAADGAANVRRLGWTARWFSACNTWLQRRKTHLRYCPFRHAFAQERDQRAPSGDCPGSTFGVHGEIAGGFDRDAPACSATPAWSRSTTSQESLG
jgi:hypothetical protein